MFHQSAWVVGSYSSGPLAARTVGTKTTRGSYRPDLSPCKNAGAKTDLGDVDGVAAVLPTGFVAAETVEALVVPEAVLGEDGEAVAQRPNGGQVRRPQRQIEGVFRVTIAAAAEEEGAVVGGVGGEEIWDGENVG